MAEINEILLTGDSGIKSFHDGSSNTDVVLYNGDYIGYMTGVTKETRREDWKSLNFAGTIDWAVDLQSFSSADFEVSDDHLDKPGERGCIGGFGLYEETDQLCQIACAYGYCPTSSCVCDKLGIVPEYPPPNQFKWQSVDPWDIEGTKLCAFACQISGNCPRSLCEIENLSPNGGRDSTEISDLCPVFWNGKYDDEQRRVCNRYCNNELKKSGDEDAFISNAGCSGFTPLGEDIQWEKGSFPGLPSDARYSLGHCFCNNPLIDEAVPTIIDALEIAGSIACVIMMSALKLVIKVGLAAFPPAGRVLEPGLDAITSAAQIIHDVYPDGEDPKGAWDFWLSPCGDLSNLPDGFMDVFDTLNSVSDNIGGRGTIKTPRGKKGTGKKGDRGNPKSFQRPAQRPTNNRPNNNNNNNGKCKGKDDKFVQRRVNTFDHVYCDKKDGKQTRDRWVATSVTYSHANREKIISGTCKAKWAQACYHYSSVISNNPKWQTMKCKSNGGTAGLGTNKLTREGGPATDVWLAEHKDESWIGAPGTGLRAKCDKDEYPGAYFFNKGDRDYAKGGQEPDAQLVRFLPGTENRGAGSMWSQACMKPLQDMQNGNIVKELKRGRSSVVTVTNSAKKAFTLTGGGVSANVWPVFTIDKWEQKPHTNDGLELNPCWPSAQAAGDPGFALLNVDPYNKKHQRPGYDYTKPYTKGSNGS